MDYQTATIRTIKGCPDEWETEQIEYIKSRISQWLEIVRTGVNENSLDANTKLSTIAMYFNDIRSGNIIFEYNTDEK